MAFIKGDLHQRCSDCKGTLFRFNIGTMKTHCQKCNKLLNIKSEKDEK